jgi:hypothetical protein
MLGRHLDGAPPRGWRASWLDVPLNRVPTSRVNGSIIFVVPTRVQAFFAFTFTRLAVSSHVDQ